MSDKNPADNFPAGYQVPKVWTWEKGNGGQFANINRPIAGPTHDKELPVGKHPLQLYSLATPNGVKVTIMLEELLAAGHKGAEYDAWLTSRQFSRRIPGSQGLDVGKGQWRPVCQYQPADRRSYA